MILVRKKNRQMNSLSMIYILLIFAAVLLYGLNVFCQNNKQLQSEYDYTQLDEIIQSAIKDSAFPGAVVLVSKDGKIIYEGQIILYPDLDKIIRDQKSYRINSVGSRIDSKKEE